VGRTRSERFYLAGYGIIMALSAVFVFARLHVVMGIVSSVPWCSRSRVPGLHVRVLMRCVCVSQSVIAASRMFKRLIASVFRCTAACVLLTSGVVATVSCRSVSAARPCSSSRLPPSVESVS
jgi:hypothetical protein